MNFSLVPWWVKWTAGAIVLGALAFGAWRIYDHVTSAYYDAGLAVGNAKVATLTAQYNAATAKVEADARAKERADAQAMAAIQTKYYEQGVTDANAKADRVIADLRAGTLRLRKQWSGCPVAADVPEAGDSRSDVDAEADARRSDAAYLVRLAAEYDARIEALQAIIRRDRGEQ